MQRRLRVPVASLATLLFLLVSFHSTPSDTSIPAPHEFPTTAASTPSAEDLGRWMTGRNPARAGFHAFGPESALPGGGPAGGEGVVRPRFGLFTPGPGDEREVRRRFLHGLPYGTAIAAAAERHKVDGLLLAAIVSVESGFAPRAVSSQGALGLMQVTPEIGEAFGGRDLLDPYVNVDVGCRYFRSLLKGAGGDVERALAAYNAGPGAVARYNGVPPYAETRSFVRDVQALYARYERKAEKAGRAHGLHLGS